MSNEEEIINQEGYFSLIGNFLTTILTGNSLYLIYFSHYIFKQLTETPETKESLLEFSVEDSTSLLIVFIL